MKITLNILLLGVIVVLIITLFTTQKKERFHKESYSGHSYVIYYSSNIPAILHDPDCKNDILKH